jgi:hypothetical protein
LGKKKTLKIEEITQNYALCVFFVTVKLYCVCELTGTMCVRLWHISREAILNSQNIKSICLPTKPKDRKTEHQMFSNIWLSLLLEVF